MIRIKPSIQATNAYKLGCSTHRKNLQSSCTKIEQQRAVCGASSHRLFSAVTSNLSLHVEAATSNANSSAVYQHNFHSGILIRNPNTIVGARLLSTQPAQPQQESGKEVNLDDFEHPRARDLFERIVKQVKSKEEVRQLGSYTISLLGRTVRENEWYYRGFGGKKIGGKGGASDEEASAVAAAPEKTAFDLKLIGFDSKSKIKVIKEVRAIAGLGLKEAKDLVESTLPKVIMKDVKKDQGEEWMNKLKEVGAEIELV